MERINSAPRPTPIAALGPQKVTAVSPTADGNHKVGQSSRSFADQRPNSPESEYARAMITVRMISVSAGDFRIVSTSALMGLAGNRYPPLPVDRSEGTEELGRWLFWRWGRGMRVGSMGRVIPTLQPFDFQY